MWQNAFQFPSRDDVGGQQQGQTLTDDSVAKLLSVLAKGQSKLATPEWPKFSDNYRSYYVFKEAGSICERLCSRCQRQNPKKVLLSKKV
jgi:hypothetical protein